MGSKAPQPIPPDRILVGIPKVSPPPPPPINRSARARLSDERAQLIAREARHLVSSNTICDAQQLGPLLDLVLSWMRVTGEIKYKRP